MKAFLVASLFLFSSASSAGQFGLEKGESLSSIRGKVALSAMESRPYLYTAEKLPQGHPGFYKYRILVTPQHGLCKIWAFTKPVESNASGDAVEANFASFYSALESKYGANFKADFLRAGSTQDKPQDWMMALAKKERRLVAYWSAEEKSSLPDDVQYIRLEAVGIDESAALIALTYEFTNADKCMDWAQKQVDSSL